MYSQSLKPKPMENLTKQYRDLETRVFNSLREAIENSSYESKHIQGKAIEINLFDYTEMAIIHDRLTFLDSKGYQYSVYSDTSLEDLIDIINKIS